MTPLILRVGANDHLRGSLSAPVTLLEYGDYECPHCGRAHPIVQRLIEALGDQLCFAFRNFPLTQIHPHAESAAEAAEAAAALGSPEKYWRYHDLLFENQDALETDDLLNYAEELGLDSRKMMRALEAQEFAPRVRQDFMTGVRSGVNGTPTFFINGERYDGDWSNVKAFVSALSAAAVAV